MHNRTLNMLLAARSLLEASGPPLTHSSDAFTVSRKVLLIQDVLELTLAAITIELGSGYKVTEQTPFSDLTAHVVSKICRDLDKDAQSELRNALGELNYARVRFKHHGDLLDAATSYSIVSRAVEIIDDLCFRASGFHLTAIDAVALVEHRDVAAAFREAQVLIMNEDYKSSLSMIARGLSILFWDYDILRIVVGKPESEDALLLSGRGIDPAAFLSMQRFLPKLSNPFTDPVFEIREYGHEANCTLQAAQFCWSTGLTVALRLQHASSIPEAKKFYDEYEDVVTIVVPITTAYRSKGTSFSPLHYPVDELKCNTGDSFWGVAKGFYGRSIDQGLNFEMALTEANWIRLSNHNLLSGDWASLVSTDDIWFEAKDIVLTYRQSELARLREQFRAQHDGEFQK